MLRLKATGDKIGSLVINPGGPGASGTSAVPSLFGTGEGADGPLPKRFDVIGLDPRGVGASTPTIDCLTDGEWEVERGDLDVDPSPAGVAQTEEENRQYAQRCTDRVGADVLANVGTRDAARDLDVLRAALGDEKLTYLGFSYGTRLGSTYAEDFPQNVRALVLDGALDPSQSTVDRSVAQAAGFQQAFDAFAAECAKQGNCPLGSDPSKATAAFQAITRPLVDRPIAVGERKLTYPDAITGVTQALYVSSAWPALAQGISALAKGDGTILLAARRPLPRPARRRQLRQRDRGVRRDQLCRRGAHHRPGRHRRRRFPRAGRRPVPRQRARGRRRPRQVRVLAGPADEHPAHAARRGPAADGGGLDDGRPGDALRGGRRPGEGARRHVVARRGRAARGGARRQFVRRRRRVGLPGRPHDPGERDRLSTRTLTWSDS